MFDLDASGVKKSVGWLSGDDGFLVRDLNGNGLIDSGAELFGDATALRAGGKAANGFAALADLDSTLDGKITSADTAFASLKVWRDLNQDGISQAGELSTLADLSITSINVAASSHGVTVVNGNTITDLGTYTRSNGSVGNLGDTANSADVNLLTDPFRTEFTTHLDTTAVAGLPDMHGSGQVRNLREAATLNPALVTLLNQFGATTTRTERLALMDSILKEWSNTSAMATTLTGAYAGHALTLTIEGTTVGTPAYQAWADKLTILEHFNGRTFHAVPAGTGPAAVTLFFAAQPLLQQSYDALRESLYGALVLQDQLAPLLDAIGLNVTETGVTLDFTGLENALRTSANTNAAKAVSDLIDLRKYGTGMLAGSGWNSALIFSELVNAHPTADVLALLTPEHIKVLFAAETNYSATFAGGETMIGNALANTLKGGAGNDTLEGGDGNDTLDGGAGNNSLYGGNGNDYLYNSTWNGSVTQLYDGGAGDDTIVGTTQSFSTLLGGAGNDVLRTDIWSYASTFEGGTGNDTLTGSYAADTYRFNLGDGMDVITEAQYSNQVNTDRIVFGSGIAPANITAVRSGGDLLLRHSNGTDQITVKNWFVSTTNQIERIEFGDGTVWLSAALNATLTIQTGTAGVDVLTASGSLNETLLGLAGNDTLTGGTGNDALDGGEGNDTLVGANGDDTLLGGDGNDTVDGGAGNNALYGGNGNDYLYNSTWNGSVTQLYDGGAGDDTIVGTTQSFSTLLGGAGNDVLRTDIWSYASTFEGGTGNDTLTGSYAADTYRFNLGDGMDVITEAQYSNQVNTDRIVFGSGIAPANITAVRSGADLLLKHSNGTDQITVKNWFVNTTYQIERIEFSDGTTWLSATVTQPLLTQTGTDGNETLTAGGIFSETLRGMGGADTLIGAAGNDTLEGGDGNDALNGAGGNNSLYGGNGNDSLTNSVSGGTQLYDGGAGDDTITGNYEALNTFLGGAGNDVITSNIWSYASTFEGGTGNDTLNGSYAADTYRFNVGDGKDVINEMQYSTQVNTDRIVFGSSIAPADISVVRSGADLLLKHSNGTDQITVKNWFVSSYYQIERIEFSNGAAWLSADITAPLLTQTGTAGADVLAASGSYSETLRGLGGNDTLTGAAGNDTLDGGDGNDTLTGGGGNNSLIGGNGNDSLYANVSGGTQLFDGGAGDDTITGNYEALNTFLGGAGNDVITSNIWSYASTFEGGTGNDTLNGSYAADTYRFNLGDGMDVINETQYSTQVNTDRIVFGSGIAPANITAVRSGTDLLLKHSNGTDQITVKNWFASTAYQVERIEFSNGTAWLSAALNTQFSALTGTASAETLNAVNGLGYSLSGLAGNDSLNGANGNDMLDGGLGDDRLIGGIGNDIYVVDSVNDVVVEVANEGVDTVDSSVTYTLAANVEHLRLTGVSALNGTGNAGDNALIGNSAANTLSGGAGNDTLDGGAGADALIGGSGNDTYRFGSGSGADTITDSDATVGNTDLALFGSGIANDQLWFRHVGNNLEVSLIGTTDKITVSNWYSGSANHVEQFKTADGKLLLDTAVENLVTAMAAFSPPAAGQTTLPPAYQTALSPVLAANWH